MNKFIILFGFGLLGLTLVMLGVFLPESEAQTGGDIEGYTEADKNIKFDRIQFDLYFRAVNIGDGDKFLNDIEAERANHILKALPTQTKKALFYDNETLGEIYRIWGAYVFKNSVSAQQVKTWFENNIPINKIDYAEFYLLKNNHHWNNPSPDEIVIHKIYGSQTQFDQVVSECNSN